MIEFKVKTNIAQLERELNAFAKKELPYAVARGLTAMAKQAQTQVRSELSRHFTIRNNYVSRGISVIPASKRDWPHSQSAVYCKDAFMTDQEEGATRQPGSLGFVSAIINPGTEQSVRPDESGMLQPSLRSKKLLQLTKSNKNYPLITMPKSGTPGILYKPAGNKYQNKARRGTALFARRKTARLEREKQTRFLWALPKTTTIQKRWNFVETVMNTHFDVFHREIALHLRKCGLK